MSNGSAWSDWEYQESEKGVVVIYFRASWSYDKRDEQVETTLGKGVGRR